MEGRLGRRKGGMLSTLRAWGIPAKGEGEKDVEELQKKLGPG